MKISIGCDHGALEQLRLKLMSVCQVSFLTSFNSA